MGITTNNNDAIQTPVEGLVAQFWRRLSVFAPPLAAGALLISGCVDDGSGSRASKDTVAEMSDVADAGDVKKVTVPDAGDVKGPKADPGKTGPDEGQSVQDGRPFMVAGSARKSPVMSAAGWHWDLAIDTSQLTSDHRAVLAAYWTETARGEHASIAAFGRSALELLHLGAPADLIAQTSQALQDEVRHAQVAFALASAYAGHDVAPGPLDMSGSLDAAMDEAAIFSSIIRGGCINETVSAALVRATAMAATVPSLKTELQRIADDEGRHAALAWQSAQWMLARNPGLKDVAIEAAGDLAVGAQPTYDEPSHVLRAHGCLSTTEQQSVIQHAVNEIVRPCMETLLG